MGSLGSSEEGNNVSPFLDEHNADYRLDDIDDECPPMFTEPQELGEFEYEDEDED